MSVKAPYERHEILSRSESGLHYVRDKRTGVLRRLTDQELADFNDPVPCEHCGEQFGCDHYNCAGEPILTDAEVEAEVPKQWLTFARESALSRQDLERLTHIVQHEGEFVPAPDSAPDMRTLELVLLLNQS